MKTRRFVRIGLALLALTIWPQLVGAQELSTVTGSPGPGVPYLVETVLPVESVRLQTHFVPVSIDVASGEQQNDFIVPFRFHGVWMFSESVVGEASWPFLLSFPGEGDAGFDVGNPRIGLEFPVFSEGGQQHRISVSFDMYLPLAQIGLGDETAQELADAAERRGRYGLAVATMPTLAPDLSAETFTPVLGLHYRLRQGKIVTHVVLDLPVYMGFDFNQDIFFHEVWTGLRYGVEATFDARPVYPSLEFVGVTTFSHDDPSVLPGGPAVELDTTTAVLGTLGIRGAFGPYEPGLAVTFPFTLDNDAIDTTVYVHFEMAYRFD